MFIYLIMLIAIIVLGIKFAHKGEFFEDFLSLKTCKGIQGICAISIMLHHLIQGVVNANEDPGVMKIFLNAGYMLVSIFFFCSGYGLYVSYKNKKNYLSGFLKKRLPTVLLPLFIINTICAIIVIASGTKYYNDLNPIAAGLQPFIYKITTFLGITLMYSDAWYVITIAIFYVAFYLVFKSCKNENKAIKIMGGITVLYAVIGMCLPPVGFFWNEGEWWYNSSFIFFIGILTAKNQKRFVDIIKEKYNFLLSVCFIGTAVLWFCAVKLDSTVIFGEIPGAYGHGIQGTVGALVCYLCKTPAEILFVGLVFLLAMKVRCKNYIISFLGMISYEIYLTHGVFLGIFRSESVHVQNSILYFALVIGCTLIASFVLHKIDSSVIKSIKDKLTR